MLIHTGSVKDIYEAGPDEFVFKFTDRYSVFDWGQMPDAIPGKGLALARMGRFFFEELARGGVKTHYLGAGQSPDEMRVRKIAVPRGNESIYATRPEYTLVPLEVIYRFGVPKGSSLLKRSKDYFEGQEFSEPLLDFTTKLERMDRALTHAEAKTLSGVTDSEWSSLLTLTAHIGQWIRTRFNGLGLKLWDGKLEFAFGPQAANGDREIWLVDTVGLDEMRLTLDGKTLSKEILRQFYLDSEWYQNLSRAKEQDTVRFKEKCLEEFKSSPSKLDPAVIHAVGAVYTAIADLLDNAPVSRLDDIRSALSTIDRALPGRPR
jgi:phosphoribosylaminoimidazole-succinocarboxamide synthase